MGTKVRTYAPEKIYDEMLVSNSIERLIEKRLLKRFDMANGEIGGCLEDIRL